MQERQRHAHGYRCRRQCVPHRKNWHPNLDGGKLKEEGTMHWNSPNVGATNESKLSFVGSGLRRDSDGSFLNKGNYSMSRCSTNSSFVRISFDDFKVITGAVPPEMGYSVRCIKD